MSERVPLGAMPSVHVPVDGEELLMGRSSNSSHYQLSANRLISRIHVRAVYNANKGRDGRGEVLLECIGWNGATIHCQGKAYELKRGDTFSSDRPGAEMLLNVQGARVLVKWPVVQHQRSLSSSPELAWEEDDTPPPPKISPRGFGSSPPLALEHLQSPVSPSPRNRFTDSSTFLGLGITASDSPTHHAVEIYEDEDEFVENDENAPPVSTAAPQFPTKRTAAPVRLPSDRSSALSDVDDFSDNDEENDPIVHAFGPYGANLQSRLAAIGTTSPQDSPRRPLQEFPVSGQVSASPQKPVASPKKQTPSPKEPSLHLSPVRNHVINQLAFSRLHSLPLSTLMSNLPAALGGEAKVGGNASAETPFGDEDLKTLLEDIACIGEIEREGRDAAGKPLENEYYYVPEGDEDEMRRDAVQQKPGLRTVRKQHKVSSSSLLMWSH